MITRRSSRWGAERLVDSITGLVTGLLIKPAGSDVVDKRGGWLDGYHWTSGHLGNRIIARLRSVSVDRWLGRWR